MRLAFLSVSSQLGGSEVMLLQLFREFCAARPGWPLHLILPGDGPLAARAADLGVAVTVVPMPESLRRVGEWGVSRRSAGRLALRIARAALHLPRYQRSLRRELARIGPDVIHTNGFKAHIVAARIHRGAAALVWHMHEYVGARPVTRTLVGRYARRCDAIVANSASVAADVRAVAGKGAPIRVVHNAVDLERFALHGPAADLDELSGLPPAPAGAVRVGLVATFSRWKGHETFLKAVAALPDPSAVRAYIIGAAVYDTEGSQYSRAELDALIRRLGLEGRVGFTGFLDAPERALRALDVVVHASTDAEAFGLVIAEAMACGRAVVTSGTGGASELVTDGENALTHRPGDAADLARGIGKLAGDRSLRERLGAAAREHACLSFDARRLAAQFEACYDESMAARSIR
jgi:glycosyltransferase involved in cell wall biosynthesis